MCATKAVELSQFFYVWNIYLFIGILLCDMKDSARGIIQNFLYLIHRFGYIPNGSRIYYLMRSQPPLLIQMAASYYTFTNDLPFIKKNIEVNRLRLDYIFLFIFTIHVLIQNINMKDPLFYWWLIQMFTSIK